MRDTRILVFLSVLTVVLAIGLQLGPVAMIPGFAGIAIGASAERFGRSV